MKLTARRLSAGVTLACAALLFPGVALVASALSSTPAAAATVARCTAADTRVWAAVEGAGTAGTTYYELELSNVGTKTCTLDGWASVWAVGTGGKQIGKPASHQGTPNTVTLAPGATSHVVLGVGDTGAICGSQGVTAAGLRIVPPGQSLPSPAGEADEIEHFSLLVCPKSTWL
jgi:streptogramin lyase